MSREWSGVEWSGEESDARGRREAGDACEKGFGGKECDKMHLPRGVLLRHTRFRVISLFGGTKTPEFLRLCLGNLFLSPCTPSSSSSSSSSISSIFKVGPRQGEERKRKRGEGRNWIGKGITEWY